MENGLIERIKAQLAVNGSHQVEGLDYHEIFSSMVKATSIHLVLIIAITHGWILSQINISNAILNGTLQERIVETTHKLR